MPFFGGKLATADIEIIRRALRAAVEGPFFPEWEFGTLFGVNRGTLRAIYEAWPCPTVEPDAVRAGVIGSLNNLLGYPHGEADALRDYFPEGLSVLSATLARLIALDP